MWTRLHQHFAMRMDVDSDSRYEQGLRKLEEIHTGIGKDVMTRLRSACQDFEELTTEFAYGDIYSRPGLDLRTRQLCTIAALTALGNGAPQLKAHINGALNLGISRQEIVEVIIQMALYGGFQCAQNAVFLAAEVFEERGV